MHYFRSRGLFAPQLTSTILLFRFGKIVIFCILGNWLRFSLVHFSPPPSSSCYFPFPFLTSPCCSHFSRVVRAIPTFTTSARCCKSWSSLLRVTTSQMRPGPATAWRSRTYRRPRVCSRKLSALPNGEPTRSGSVCPGNGYCPFLLCSCRSCSPSYGSTLTNS